MNEPLIQCENLKPEMVTVDENYITIYRFENDGTVHAKNINPFDVKFNSDKPLFLKFISIDTDNLLSIKQFVKDYGLLGLYIDNELSIDKDLNDLMSSFTLRQVNKAMQNNYNIDENKYSEDLSRLAPKLIKIISNRITNDTKRFNLESTKAFIQEVRTMRCLSNLYNTEDLNKIKKFINELKSLLKDKKDDFQVIEDVVSKHNLQDNLNLKIVSYFVCEKMKNTEFSSVVEWKPDEDPKIKMQYFVPTLLSGLYTMFYFYIVNGGLIRQCPVCGNFYDNNNSGCSTGCIKVISSRKYRDEKSKDPIFLEFEKQRKSMYARIKAKGDNIRITKLEYMRWYETAKIIKSESKSVEEFKTKIEKNKI